MGGIRPVVRSTADAKPAESLRLFVAILLPDDWLAALAGTQDGLRDAGLDLRCVRAEGIHLTLKFLGETPARRVAEISSTLEAAAARAGPCEVTLGASGFFGPRRRPRVVWQGIEGDLSALAAVQRAVDEALAGLGFARETRPFSPHLTLARVPDNLPAAEAERIAPAVEGLSRPHAAPLHVESFALMRSELGRGGARYTQLASWPLGRPSEA